MGLTEERRINNPSYKKAMGVVSDGKPSFTAPRPDAYDGH